MDEVKNMREATPAIDRTGSNITVRAALPAEYSTVDAVIDAAYEHDYGPRQRTQADDFHHAEVRARDYHVWIALGHHRPGGKDLILGSTTLRRPGGSTPAGGHTHWRTGLQATGSIATGQAARDRRAPG